MNTTLKHTLGKAAYQQLLSCEIRTIRRIAHRDKVLSKWYRTGGSLFDKLHALREFIHHRINYTRKLTYHHMYLAYGRKASRYDRVDFVRNQYSPYLPR